MTFALQRGHVINNRVASATHSFRLQYGQCHARGTTFSLVTGTLMGGTLPRYMGTTITWLVLGSALVLAAIGYEIWGPEATGVAGDEHCYQTRDGLDCYDLPHEEPPEYSLPTTRQDEI